MVIFLFVETIQDLFPRTILLNHFLVVGPDLRFNSHGKSLNQLFNDTFCMLTMFQHIKIHKRLFDWPSSNEFFAGNIAYAEIGFREEFEVGLNEVLFWLDCSLAWFEAVVDEFVFDALEGTELQVSGWCGGHVLKILLLICDFCRS